MIDVMASCPMCAEELPAGAPACPHCGEALAPSDPAPSRTYDVLQDKVGLVPNTRFKDNALQAAVTAAGMLIGVVAGGVTGGREGALFGLLGGLVVGGLGSGFVLMIVGLVRR